jgi:hypothetical protein
MNTKELIAKLREIDPSGDEEVWLEIHNGERASDARTYHDIANIVSRDEAGDVVITGETE